MTDVEKVVSIALGEVGYREKATNGQLDLAAANAGTGNWTKYARDLFDAGYYNGNKNGYEWCDVFVDWVFFKAFGRTEGELMQYQSGPLGAACPYSAGYYKARGRYDAAPRAGDQVFFQKDGELVHTGIVTEVSSGWIASVEGNAGNRVELRYHQRQDAAIDGYGHPDYAGSAASGVSAYEQVKAWQAWLGVTADGRYGPATRDAALERALRGYLKERPLKRGDSGDAVRAVQGRLYALGYDPKGLDGKYGGGMTAAVRAYQADTDGLTADGETGEDTFAALFSL